MSLFFVSGTSLSMQKVADLQRRACWVGIAVMLQFCNETLRVAIQAVESKYTSTVTLLDPASNLILVTLIGGSFLALWMAFRPTQTKSVGTGPDRGEPYPPQGISRSEAPVRISTEDQRASRKISSAWQVWICTICLILALIGIGACAVSIVRCFMPMQFANDGTVLDTKAAVTLLHGDDPYANPNLSNLNLMNDVSLHAEWTTPLRNGRFAGELEYPTNDDLEAALLSGLKTTYAQEFDTKVCYPALSFISLITFACLNHFNVLPLSILCQLLFV